MHVRTEIADLRCTPSLEAPIDTQILFGETVTLYDKDEGGRGFNSRATAMSAMCRATLLPRGRRRRRIAL